MQSRNGFPALLLIAALSTSLAACGDTSGSSTNDAQPQTPAVTVTTTSAPTPEDSPSPSDSATTDPHSEDNPTDDPTTAPDQTDSSYVPATSCKTAQVNPDDCAKVLTDLKSKARTKLYERIVPVIGLKLARMLLKQKHTRTYDASGNKFTLDAGFTGWATITSSDGKLYTRAYLRNGQIVTKVEITEISIRDQHHSSKSEVATGGIIHPGDFWLTAKCTGTTLRVTDLGVFDHYYQPRPTLRATCGSTTTISGPTNLGDSQGLDEAILGQLQDDAKANKL